MVTKEELEALLNASSKSLKDELKSSEDRLQSHMLESHEFMRRELKATQWHVKQLYARIGTDPPPPPTDGGASLPPGDRVTPMEPPQVPLDEQISEHDMSIAGLRSDLIIVQNQISAHAKKSEERANKSEEKIDKAITELDKQSKAMGLNVQKSLEWLVFTDEGRKTCRRVIIQAAKAAALAYLTFKVAVGQLDKPQTQASKPVTTEVHGPTTSSAP